MRTQSMDTRPETEHYQIALIRKTPLIERFRRVAYSFDDLLPLIEMCERMDIIYYIQSGVAGAAYGMERVVTNIELVVDLQTRHIASFLAKLGTIYNIDEDVVRNAVAHRSAFGIHCHTWMELTVFLTRDDPFDQEVRRRVQTLALLENHRPFYLASPEDVVLTQLEGYRRTGERDDERWKELIGVLKPQGMPLDLVYLQRWADWIDLPLQQQWTSPLDFSYLQQWATTLGIADLLEKALVDAGI